jgi:hypothetical protein
VLGVDVIDAERHCFVLLEDRKLALREDIEVK